MGRAKGKFCDDCGYSLGSSHATNHDKGSRIMAAIRADVPFRDIARQEGMTHQRIQQMALAVGFTGKQRLDRERVVRRQGHIETLRSHIMASWPLLAERIAHFRMSSEVGLSLKRIVIEDRRCLLRTARMKDVDGRWYVQVHKIRETGPFEFVLFSLPEIPTWIVFPRSHLPANGTYFSLEEPDHNKGRVVLNRHDFRYFVEAWPLLADPEKLASLPDVPTIQVFQRASRFVRSRRPACVDRPIDLNDPSRVFLNGIPRPAPVPEHVAQAFLGREADVREQALRYDDWERGQIPRVSHPDGAL